MKRFVTTLTPKKITELLSRNEIDLAGRALPKCIRSVECNQLASNNPIEDRLRVSSIVLPGAREPSLILGVFDGHGGGTTADLISSRLFNYIALSLHPDPKRLKISNYNDLKEIVVDLHSSPLSRTNEHDLGLGPNELKSLANYKEDLKDSPSDIASNLKASFRRCDDDLSWEIQTNLTNARSSKSMLHHYLSAAVSGCCALVVLIHQGVGYMASTGDCRAVLGKHNKFDTAAEVTDQHDFSAVDLNEEHNCDNINEVRRLTASHPKSEQNTMIKHNRLLGHLMPFRAFGDFTYKWPVELIKACGITTAFGSGVIPMHYETPPYLIAEPDVKEIKLEDNKEEIEEKYLVVASDGLWELFESSRDVIETIVDHSVNSNRPPGLADEYDKNCATHILRSALRYSSPHDIGLDKEELKKLYHIRLESALTLPQAVVRNFRDDISIVMIRLQ